MPLPAKLTYLRVTTAYLRNALAHAPKDAAYMGPDGWDVETTDLGTVYVCAACAARIMARGCSLGKVTPIWHDRDGIPCVLCNPNSVMEPANA